ncbi:hypothetical protein M0R45_034361 [Rubus argutus]|uniref:PGG domain-containing protein n=1 Tax=Rubus argutus TaxID=59490 RepID=A0AAW1VQV8_RUBAR
MTAIVVPSVIVNLDVLSEDNYEDWIFRVKTYLVAEGLWKVVEVPTDPDKLKLKDGEEKFNAWNKDNAKALHAIHISCGHNAFASIKGVHKAKDAWDILVDKFKPIEVNMDIQPTEGSESQISEPFLAVHDVDWDFIMQSILSSADAAARARARHPLNGSTILHYAVSAAKVDIVRKLVELMSVEDLEISNNIKNTALGTAIVGKDTDQMVEIVKCLVKKNEKLLTIADSAKNIPLVGAFMLQKWKMATYIYSVTPNLKDTDAAQLVSLGIVHKFLDIPLEIIWNNPRLGITEYDVGKSPLFHLADTRSVFLSGSSLNFWQRWIYHCVRIDVEHLTIIHDLRIYVPTPERRQGNQRHLIGSVEHCFRGLVTNLRKLVGIDRIYQMKLIHTQALQILRHICLVLATDGDNVDDNVVSAIFRAVQLGQVEFITQICKQIPHFKYIFDVDRKSLFQFAVECRQEKIYNLIYGLDEQEQKYFADRTDNSGNNMLHTIGLISSFAKIDHIRGAALQMQRELQWFKEVDNIVSPHARETINVKDRIKPFDLFTTNHIELVKEGEKSIKETATSCTVVGALIVTIMFAAAFTVPGGNNERSGFPKFLDQKEFKIFIASDAISLFFSTTSVMIFLGMLTSRYAQDDFLISLPRKMILGLLTLFISIAAMMVAFSSALFLMVPSESWIAFPALLLSTIPIASFVWMQFPLLADIIIYTYGAGAFDRKVQPWDKDTEQECLIGKSNFREGDEFVAWLGTTAWKKLGGSEDEHEMDDSGKEQGWDGTGQIAAARHGRRR